MPSAITMQFVGGEGLGSKIIAWFGHGLPVSHVDTVMPDGSLLGARSDRVGGRPPGVQIRPADYEPWKYRLRMVLPCPEPMAQKYYAFVQSQLYKPYDQPGLFGAFLFDRDWRTPDAWWCSELNARGLEPDVSGYLGHMLASPANQIDPMSLLLVMSVFVAMPTNLRKAAIVAPSA